MSESKNVYELLDTLAKILLRCFVLGYALLLLCFLLYVSAGDVMFDIHAKLFSITPHEMELMHYCGMAFVKCVVLLFFLFPYVAIRLVLRTRAPDTVNAGRSS